MFDLVRFATVEQEIYPAQEPNVGPPQPKRKVPHQQGIRWTLQKTAESSPNLEASKKSSHTISPPRRLVQIILSFLTFTLESYYFPIGSFFHASTCISFLFLVKHLTDGMDQPFGLERLVYKWDIIAA